MLENYKKLQRKKNLIIIILLILVLIMTILCLFVGSSNMSFIESIKAIFYSSTPMNNRIMYNIRMPRALACLIAGAGLSLSGLIMQSTLGNSMASPSTLGVSNAAVFGANLSMIVFAGGFISSGNNINNYFNQANPFQTSFMAFIFSFLSILLILGLCRIRSFSPNVVVLAGIAIGSIWQAGTTILQYFATDVGIQASVVWSFGDLSRATYQTDLIMAIIVLLGFIFFYLSSWKYNAILCGDNQAISLGVNVKLLRFLSLLISSLITASCVSFLGIIGFVGIICPHITKKIIGANHKYTIPASLLTGSLLLLTADTVAKLIGHGSALPVGAITSIIGAPFFLYIIFRRER